MNYGYPESEEEQEVHLEKNNNDHQAPKRSADVSLVADGPSDDDEGGDDGLERNVRRRLMDNIIPDGQQQDEFEEDDDEKFQDGDDNAQQQPQHPSTPTSQFRWYKAPVYVAGSVGKSVLYVATLGTFGGGSQQKQLPVETQLYDDGGDASEIGVTEKEGEGKHHLPPQEEEEEEEPVKETRRKNLFDVVLQSLMEKEKAIISIDMLLEMDLGTLEGNSSPMQEFTIADGCDFIVRAMLEHNDNETIQYKCSGLMADLTTCDHDQQHQKSSFVPSILSCHKKNVLAFDKAGAAAAVVIAMKQLPNHQIMQWNGCKALNNLASHPKCCKHVLQQGGMAVVLQAMATYPDDAKIQKSACEFFANVGKHSDSNRALIVHEGGGRALADTQHRFSTARKTHFAAPTAAGADAGGQQEEKEHHNDDNDEEDRESKLIVEQAVNKALKVLHNSGK